MSEVGPSQAPEISIDIRSIAPPFEQVRSQLAAQISSGQLPVGTRLPTVRWLAGDLGLAVNTVARAFGELEKAGLVVTRGRAGTVVGSGGDANRERVRRAARDYAQLTRSVGLTADDAVGMVRAALEDG